MPTYTILRLIGTQIIVSLLNLHLIPESQTTFSFVLL